MSKHGTPLTTQFITVLTAVIKAVATAVEDFNIVVLMNVLTSNGEKLTQYMRLVFTALMNGQEVVLAAAQTVSKRLLEGFGTVSVAAVEKFVAYDYFKVGDSRGVKIVFLSDTFKKYFIPKVEQRIATTLIRVFKLIAVSLDSPIITELEYKGVEHETTLAHLWELLKAQGYGRKGKLSTWGDANIFYIRDCQGTLWAVNVDRSSAGWSVSAYSIDDSRKWDAGDRVFGR